MTQHAQAVWDAAAGWLARTHDPSFDDWDGFTAWLEDDPSHADAYQELADSALRLDPLLAEADLAPTPVAEPEHRRQPWRWAAAACVAGLSALGVAVVPQWRGETYVTAPGEIRTIALAEGDTLVLNGGTSLRVAQFAGRRVTLNNGQVLLRLNGHGDPVSVRSGDLELVDVGTVFEVARADRSTRVLVSEGEVMADPSSAKVAIGAGQRLDADDGARMLKAEPGSIDSVGSWEHGQLSYSGEPLGLVIEDLRRSTGIDFSISPAMRQRQFSGTLSVASVRRDPASLGPLLGVPVERSGGRWTLGKG